MPNIKVVNMAGKEVGELALSERVFGAEAKMIALQFIKKQPKCKSAKLTDIERVFKERYWNPLSGTHENRYLIIAKNKTFKMK